MVPYRLSILGTPAIQLPAKPSLPYFCRLVEPVEAASDLDNLRLQELGEAPVMEATYELEASTAACCLLLLLCESYRATLQISS